MRYELKSISLWSVIRVSFFLNTFIGFILGIFFAFFMSIYFAAASSLPGLAAGGFDFSESSIGAVLIIFPLIGAACGAVFHTLFAMIISLAYNLISRLTGGLEFDLELAGAKSGKSETVVDNKPKPVTPSPATPVPSSAPPPPPPPFATKIETPKEETPPGVSTNPPPSNLPDSGDGDDIQNI